LGWRCCLFQLDTGERRFVPELIEYGLFDHPAGFGEGSGHGGAELLRQLEGGCSDGQLLRMQGQGFVEIAGERKQLGGVEMVGSFSMSLIGGLDKDSGDCRRLARKCIPGCLHGALCECGLCPALFPEEVKTRNRDSGGGYESVSCTIRRSRGSGERSGALNHPEKSVIVYEQLGFPDAEAMLVKAQLVTQITEILRGRGWSQQQAAKVLGLTRPSSPRCGAGSFAASAR